MSVKHSTKNLIDLIKHELICPITGQYFLEPVTIPSGITYEKSAILLYFEETKTDKYVRCPVTRLQIFNYDFEPRHDGSIKDLHPNLNIKSIVDELVKSGFISGYERFRLHLFEAPIASRSLEDIYCNVYDKDLEKFCDELKYCEYSMKELFEKFIFSFGSTPKGPGRSEYHYDMTKRIYNSILDHVVHDKIKGLDEFMSFIDFCVRRLHLLDDCNLDYVIKSFDLDEIPSEIFLDNELVKILYFEKTFNRFLKTRGDEINAFFENLSQSEWEKLFQNLLYPNDRHLPMSRADSINYNLLIYIAEHHSDKFNENFRRFTGSMDHILSSHVKLSHKQLKFIHILNTQFPGKINYEILNLLLQKYEKIEREHLNVIGYYDLDTEKYVLKSNPNYHTSIEATYLDGDSAFVIYGVQRPSKNEGSHHLTFSNLELTVDAYRNRNQDYINDFEYKFRYNRQDVSKFDRLPDL